MKGNKRWMSFNGPKILEDKRCTIKPACIGALKLKGKICFVYSRCIIMARCIMWIARPS